MSEHNEPTEAERSVLTAYCDALTSLTNVSQAHVRPEVLADCLISGAAKILRGLHGAPIAAERLRQCANLIDEQHPTAKH